jgi:DNA-binding Xre family transcriptional regulator
MKMQESKLSQMLKKKGITAYRLAKMLNLSPQAVYKLVDRGVKSVRTAENIAPHLNCDPLFLLELSTNRLTKERRA